MSGTTRRQFLQRGAVAAGALALPVPALPRKTARVVLVAFAGGVRSKEVLDSPQNAPNLMRIASAGVTLPNVRVRNVGHYGATLSLFTGNFEVLGIRENERGMTPTLFEYLAKDAGVPTGEIWLSTASGAQGRLFAHSDHPQYGAAFGANVLDGDGIFNVEFKRVLDSFGRPRRDTPAERSQLERLVAAMESGKETTGDAAQLRRVEQFILDELEGANTRLTGPGAGDAKAIRVGMNIFRVFRPRVLGITLQAHDVAHSSYNSYVEVIRRNDEEIGKLWDSIQQDPELRATTAVFVLPEFGRDRNLNERNGLDHGDSSDELHKVFLIAAGPEFKQNKVVRQEIQSIDVCPTVLSLFTSRKPAFSGARVIRELFG
jgi:hypothetical protein